VVSDGAREERGERGSTAAGRRQVGTGHTVLGCGSNSVLNQFKNIQTVQMKFEFFQNLADSKDTFLYFKNLK
jgi:hypothetical protein